MKKISILLLTLIVCFNVNKIKAQAPGISFNPTICFNPGGTNSISAVVTATTSGATNYTWSVISSTNTSLTGTITQISGTTGTNVAIEFPACGGYSVICYAYNSSTLVNANFSTANVVCSNSLTVANSSTLITCIGAPRTLSVSSLLGSGYSWTDGISTISTLSTAVVSPTANTCYTVVGTASAGCTASAVVCVSVTSQPTVIATATQTSTCPGTMLSLSASGATSYTWITGSSAYQGASWNTYPASSGCYTLLGQNGAACTGSALACFTFQPYPSISASPSGPVCIGSPVTLSLPAATGYTWVSGATVLSNSSSVVVTPMNSYNTYSVISINASGCTTYTNIAFSGIASPTVFISTSVGSSSICLGSTVSFSAISGAATGYTWMPGNYNSNTATFTPSVNTCYTLIVSSAQGCTTSAVECVTVSSLPNITIAGNSTVCVGGSLSLIASGASSYIWNTLASSSSIVVTPTANTCYTATGTNASGCVGAASACITLQSTIITLAPTSQIVCEGSNADLSGSGATSYTWSTGASSSTLHVLPASTHNYTLSGTGSNGCIGVAVATVVVDTTCSDVWPGDTNSDGVVDNTDVFEIGLAYGNTGPARSPGGNTFISQHAGNWSGTVSTSKNQNHADCNGDGTINLSDTLAIYTNYSLTHAFKPSETSLNPDVYLFSSDNLAITGQWNHADIMLGDITTPLTQVYGVAFDVNFDKDLIETNSAYILYTSSFLNASNTNVEFRKSVYSDGKIHAASVRTNGNNVNGSGKIGEFWYKMKSGLADNTSLTLSTSNGTRIDKTGLNTSLSGGSTLMTALITGIKERNIFSNAVNLYPNPATNQLNFTSGISGSVHYFISDILGREIITGEFTKSTSLNISGINPGTYTVRFTSGSAVTYKKLVIEK